MAYRCRYTPNPLGLILLGSGMAFLPANVEL